MSNSKVLYLTDEIERNKLEYQLEILTLEKTISEFKKLNFDTTELIKRHASLERKLAKLLRQKHGS